VQLSDIEPSYLTRKGFTLISGDNLYNNESCVIKKAALVISNYSNEHYLSSRTLATGGRPQGKMLI